MSPFLFTASIIHYICSLATLCTVMNCHKERVSTAPTIPHKTCMLVLGIGLNESVSKTVFSIYSSLSLTPSSTDLAYRKSGSFVSKCVVCE